MICAAALLSWPTLASGQVATFSGDTLYELRLPDGDKHIGRIEAQQGDSVMFQTLGGVRLQVHRQMVRLRLARGRIVDGEFWREDRNLTRLFFAPTGRVLESGHGYAGLFWFLPFVGAGITDNLTMAGGVPLVGDLSETPVWLAPKLRIVNRTRTQGSVGVIAVRTPGTENTFCDPLGPGCTTTTEDASWFGIAYGIATLGDNDNALHLGAGVAFGEDVDADFSRFPLMIGGERRTGRRWKVITENWLLPGEGGAASLGMRRVGEHWTWDFGLMALFGGDDSVPYFPIVSFSYSWGR